MPGFLCFTQCVTSRKTFVNIMLELMAIVFAFHQFIYGGTILVKTDHRPLVNLFKKPLKDFQQGFKGSYSDYRNTTLK